MTALLAGFSLGISLILAIGSQNAFVLRQGLRQEHVFWICLVCALSDAVLIVTGILGLSVVLQQLPWLDSAMRYAGCAFLFIYGARSFLAALRSSAVLVPSEVPSKSLWATLWICLGLTWLNPHVYLDTVFLIGSVATQFAGHKLEFAVGAASASIVFFFSLGYGASLLKPLFAKPSAWKVLEIVVGVTMWAIALSLLLDDRSA
jgi:L-lysine exporter family protein LysE/ArgO